ncbi:MAG: CRISPR-associated endonuclease Cas2 [Candidatus Anstonellales archaeon]
MVKLFIIMAYDMDTTDENYENNARKVRQIASRYLNRIQKSVFYGNLSEGKFKELEMQIRTSIKNSNDKIVFYVFEDNVKYIVIKINHNEDEIIL